MARILSEESSLTRQQKQLARETGVLRYLLWAEAALAAGLAVAGAVQLARGGSSGLLWVAAATGFFAWGHHLKTRQNARAGVVLAAGTRGEEEVARVVAAGLDNTYYVFNDIRLRAGMKKAQVDHVVIGPNGAFVIETKNWGGHLDGGAQEKRWKQARRDGSIRLLSNPLVQNERHAEVVRALLKRERCGTVPVVPLLVFARSQTTLDIQGAHDRILWVGEVCDAIRQTAVGAALDEAAVDAAVRALRRGLA